MKLIDSNLRLKQIENDMINLRRRHTNGRDVGNVGGGQRSED